jgi:SAM-dependent methyltransferase
MIHSFVSRDTCPACASAAVVTAYSCGFAQPPIRGFIENYYKIDPALLGDASYELVRCRDCTLLYQRWIGDDALLAELYGVWIEKDFDPAGDPQYRKAVSSPRASRDGHEIMAAAAHLGLRAEEMTTLDYGMGWAMWARIAKDLGCRSFGNDLSPSRMAFAEEHGVATLSDEALAGQRFHFINTEQVFEHVARPLELARRLVDALLPGGILKISVPAGEGADKVVEQLVAGGDPSAEALVPIQPLEHVNCFTHRSLDALARATGARIVEPRLTHRYAFVRARGGLQLGDPKGAVKELVRPFYQFNNRTNLYRWLQKPA